MNLKKLLICLGTLLLAALVRLQGLTTLGWYTDEGTQLAIARALQNGQWAYLALTQSTLLVARPPLFPLLLAAWFHLVPLDIFWLRALTCGLSLGTTLTFYAFTAARVPWRVCALAALGYALCPPAAIYNRFGFSYNLLALLALWAFYGLCVHAHTRHPRPLVLAALALGVGPLCDVWALALWPFFLLALRLSRAPLWAPFWAIPLAALPLALYAATMYATVPHAFLFDLHFTLARLSAPLWPNQFLNLVDNAALWLGSDLWLWFALGGWCAGSCPQVVRRLGLGYLALTFLAIARTNPLYSLSTYYRIPLWPLLPFGAAALVIRLSNLGNTTPHWRIARLALITAFFAFQLRPALFPVPTPIDNFLLDPTAARAAIAYLQSHIRSTDVVITSPTLAWAIPGHPADFQMAVAQTGHPTPHFPANLPPNRWAFNARLENAQWVVVDNLWPEWAAVHLPEINAWLQTAPPAAIVWQQGPITIYHFPR